MTPNALASLRQLERAASESTTLKKLGRNTNKLKTKLLPSMQFVDVLRLFKVAVGQLSCTQASRSYLNSIEEDELRGWYCKVLTIARNFCAIPSSNWRGDVDVTPVVDLDRRNRDTRKGAVGLRWAFCPMRSSEGAQSQPCPASYSCGLAA